MMLGFMAPRKTVQHEAYCGIFVNSLNNEVPAWDDPVDVKVYGWKLNTTEQREVRQVNFTSRQTTEGRLLYPTSLEVKVRDIFTLPLGRYEVVEVVDLSGNPFEWHPGDYCLIRRITPKGTER